ncbi:MAG: carboxypeptidase regulatory-like domain-containing protein [Clostridia bacterium]|nr:carboxypeptidase regulatory-like domain-containing protein [Clostridia bacterium]
MRRSLTVFLLACLLCALPLCALAERGQIGGHAYLDDGSGLYSADSRALSGVTVTLYSIGSGGEESQAARVVTQADGAFSFTGLSTGTYRLRASLPEGCQYALPREGGSAMLPASGGESFSMSMAISSAGEALEANIGATRGSTYIKVLAFEDVNQNGGRSTSEALLRGVEVTLYYELNGEMVEIGTARTDQNGEALFLHLTPGTYRVGAVLPAPYIIGPLGEKTSLWYNCIPPCDSNEGVTAPVTALRGDSLGIGVGAVSTGSLQGVLWYDADMDGIKKGGEGGFAGATVSLTSRDAGVDRSLVTGADGAYSFEGLLAGSYTLRVELPEEYMFTLPGGDSLLTEGYAFSASRTVNVQDQAVGQIPPIGVMPATSLSVRVYNDVNTNGAFDPDEPVFAGAALQAIKGESVRAEAISDGEGLARIPVLRGGDTDVRLTLPDGQVFTVEGVQNDFSALAATGDMTLTLSLPHGQETTLYAGVTLPAAVAGRLFNDENLSGVMEDGETGLSGFTVQAVNAEGAVTAQTFTDADGAYAFRSLLPAPHTIRFTLADAYTATDLSESGAQTENRIAHQTAEYGETALLSLAPGQRLEGVSGGIFRSATVSGQVLLRSGIDSLPAEGGMEGVLVTLLDDEDKPVSDTTAAYTDENGAFYLKGALPGVYRLRFTLPEDAAFSDPALEESWLTSDSFELHVADDLAWETVYAIHTGSLSGTLYRDANLNGHRDADEETYAGIALRMENNDLNKAYEAVTLSDGSYSFDKLRPGSFTLSLTLPEGLCFAYDETSPVASQVGGTALSPLSIGIGDHQTGRDIAAAAPAVLSGTVYYDLTNDGHLDPDDPGADDVTISFTSAVSALSYTVQTDANGRFTLPAMVPGAYIMRVTLGNACVVGDRNTAQLNNGFWTSRITLQDGMTAGLQYPILRYATVAGHVWSLDGTLNGVAGRKVQLYGEGSDDPLETAITDESGAFSFGELKPGRYRLQCDLPDSRYNFARPADAALYAGTPDVPVGYYDFFDVAMGAELTACDIGIGAMGALGDTAWLDLNGDGLQDGDEPCLPGVKIALFQYGELAAEAVTDRQGRYLITDLYPGAYTVRVTLPDEVKTTVHRIDYPLAASVLPQSEEGVVEAEGVIVPSAGRNLNCDFGFVLRKDGVFPAELSQLYSIDWSYGGTRK